MFLESAGERYLRATKMWFMRKRAERELELLRQSVRRLAQRTKDPDIIKYIPQLNTTTRGWNLLCGLLGNWIEKQQRQQRGHHRARPTMTGQKMRGLLK